MPVNSAYSAETASATGSETSASPMPCGGEYADRIGAEPDEGGVAERDQRAVADQEIERNRGDGEDHHPRPQAEQIAAARSSAASGSSGKRQENADRQNLECAARRRRDVGRDAAAACPAHLNGPSPGTGPVGRTYSTTAISR